MATFGLSGFANASDVDSPFLAQIEQILGENSVPDSDFFLEAWTVGLSAATQSFQRRQREGKPSAANPFNAFYATPMFMVGEETNHDLWSALRQRGAGQTYSAFTVNTSDEDEDQQRIFAEVSRPLTQEAACRVLGVHTSSAQEEVRSAYRKLANRYHPDRQMRTDARKQMIASDRMALINEAYGLLRTGNCQAQQ